VSDPRHPYRGRRHAPAVAGAPALEVAGLWAGYPQDREPALRDVSWRVAVGARVALVGPNGAGKSTLLKAAAGVLRPARGSIRVYGQPVGACHHRVAYLPQRSEVDWQFPVTVRRLVLTGRYVHVGWLRRPAAEDRAITDRVLERLGLAEVAERQVGQLSGGQQQRALIARALAQEADLLLLDEPLNAVDGETRAVLEQLLDALRGAGKTVVVATHDVGRVEGGFDDALYLSDGCATQPPPGGHVPSQLCAHPHDAHDAAPARR
jgi:manganese/zinc/iron transport system ATP- binding protein